MTEIKNPLKGLTEYGWHFEQEVFLSSGIARTVKSREGTGNIPKVIEYETKGRDNVQGSILASLGGGQS